MIPQTSSSFVLREPGPEELGRVIHLFRNSQVPSQARMLGALKSRPVERFVAATAWWIEGPVVRFKLAIQPGLTERSEVCALLIQQVAEGCRRFGIPSLYYGELLADDSEWIAPLKECGFFSLRSERFFEVSAVQSRSRTLQMYEKYRADIPASWRTEPIRNHAPDVILELIAPYRLMPVEELRHAWRPDAPQGFYLDGSSILFDGTRPIGVMLLRQVRDAYFVDVRVVQAENRLQRSLGNVMLFYHLSQWDDPSGVIRRLQFRAGETEHRETANLARRMGGCELPPRHVFAKNL